MYCNFEYTGNEFRNKKVYKCKDCGITLGLEDPNIKILCFKQQQKLSEITFQQLAQQPVMDMHVSDDIDLAQIAENDLIRRSRAKEDEDNPDNMCSNEEVSARLDICNKCEHYQDNACLLCGCKIVRDLNYQNKLAHRNASCPINKWGPIPTIKT